MKRRFEDLLLHAGMLALALLWIAPLWLMFVFATLPEEEIFRVPTPLLPGGLLGANVANLHSDTQFLRALGNSLGIALVTTALSVLLSSMGGYAFARYRFRGQGALFAGVLATLTVPYFVLVIPQYILVARDLRLTNTWWAVILPALANSLGIFFMRQNFLGTSESVLEAARVDGAGEFSIFFRIALPMSAPALAALALILFLNSWNDYLWPLLVLSEDEMFTAPVALGTLVGLTRVSWGGIMAGALLLTAPLLGLFLLLQRHFLGGIAAGAVKD